MDKLKIYQLENIVKIKEPYASLVGAKKADLIAQISTLFTLDEINRILAMDMFEEEVIAALSPNPDLCPVNPTLNKDRNAWFNCSTPSYKHGYHILIVPEGMRFYYGSHKFKEQILYERLYSKPQTMYPTKTNFFLTSNAEALAYTHSVGDVGKRYGRAKLTVEDDFAEALFDTKIPIHVDYTFDVIHVYKTTNELHLFDIYDIRNLRRLLYEDTDSPFHVSKRGISLTDDISDVDFLMSFVKDDHNFIEGVLGSSAADEFMIRTFMAIPAGRESNRFYPHKVNKVNAIYGESETCMFSGFILLQIAMSFHLIQPGMNYTPVRRSAYIYDYYIANAFRSYFTDKHISGWGSLKLHKFHSEICIFEPDKTKLVRDKDSILDWEHIFPFEVSPLRKRAAALDNFTQELMFSQQYMEQKLNISREELEKANDYLKGRTTSGYEYESIEDAKYWQKQYDKNMMNLEAVKSGELVESHITDYLRIVGIPDYRRVMNKKLRLMWHKRGKKECEVLRKCFDSIGDNCNMNWLIDEMRKYPNKNTFHHRGESVADHCIWVSRCLRNWLQYENEPWTGKIHYELWNVTMVSGIMHDIGKIGDADFVTRIKPRHPHIGFLYALDEIPFKGERCNKRGKQLLKKLDDCYACEMTMEEEIIVNICIAMHHFLGEVLIKHGQLSAHIMPDDFINPGIKHSFYGALKATAERVHLTVLAEIVASLDPELKYYYMAWYLIEYLIRMSVLEHVLRKPQFMEQLLLVLFAVSAADVFGAHPVEVEEKPEMMDPYYLSFLSKDTSTMPNPGGIPVPPVLRPYYKFMYYSIGIEERDKFMNIWSTIKDHRRFHAAWSQISKLSAKDFEIGPSFRFSYGIHTADDWIAAFIRVLRTGEVPSASASVSTFNIDTLIPKLNNKITERSMAELKKFKFMKPPGLKKKIVKTARAAREAPM